MSSSSSPFEALTDPNESVCSFLYRVFPGWQTHQHRAGTRIRHPDDEHTAYLVELQCETCSPYWAQWRSSAQPIAWSCEKIRVCIFIVLFSFSFRGLIYLSFDFTDLSALAPCLTLHPSLNVQCCCLFELGLVISPDCSHTLWPTCRDWTPISLVRMMTFPLKLNEYLAQPSYIRSFQEEVNVA